MDEIDLQLLEVIQNNGRGAYSHFGKTVGLSTTAIHDRLKKLSTEGIITGWGARLDPAQVGYPIILLVRVEVDLPANREIFSDTVAQIPGVQECHLTSGQWNCWIKLRASSVEQAETIITEKIAPLKGVVAIQMDVVNKTKKETLHLPVK